jgi:uncharacterized protein YggT (Ycf19 family)
MLNYNFCMVILFGKILYYLFLLSILATWPKKNKHYIMRFLYKQS